MSCSEEDISVGDTCCETVEGRQTGMERTIPAGAEGPSGDSYCGVAAGCNTGGVGGVPRVGRGARKDA